MKNTAGIILKAKNEVWDGSQKGDFFEKSYYDGNSFLQHIILGHSVVFLKLQAYFENDRFFDIHSYQEFVDSDCQLLLLIYDCQAVEIYAKDQPEIKSIYENALLNGYTEIQYVTDSNDGRTKMDVL